MSAIVVGVRVRPFNSRENRFNSQSIIEMVEATNTVKLKVVRQGKIMPDQPREFSFDHLLWTHDGGPEDGSKTPSGNTYAGQESTYKCLGLPVLENACAGYNSCLFAYGQTGSGKTYSMMGYDSDAGIIPRICTDLFVKASTLGSVRVECSYLEIYNEVIKDLLTDNAEPGALKVRQHPKTGVFVDGLKKVAVHSAKEILALVEQGSAIRTVAATNMNATSSRSHAVLLVTVTQVAEGGTGKVGKMSLVDLAGSERADSTGAKGDTLVEGANINKSLTILGMCLGRLADRAVDPKSSLHVPYRDSALTYMLSESLGGNSKTSMLAAISPADVNFDETLSTLRFAQVTKKVKNNAVVNENPTTKLIRELKDELKALKEQLKGFEDANANVDRPVVAESEAEKEGEGASTEGDGALEELRAKIMASEAAEKELAEEAESFTEVQQKDESSVFVDWCKPQLVSVSPDALSLTLAVKEGTYFMNFRDLDNPASKVDLSLNQQSEGLSIRYDPLRNVCCLMTGTVRVVVNGSAYDTSETGHKVNLGHGDRIVVGSHVFRFAHSSSLKSATEFSSRPLSIEHLEELERHERYSKVELPFFTIMQQWHREMSGADADDDDFESGTSSICALLSNLVQKCEESMASDFPITSEELLLHSKREARRAAKRKEREGTSETDESESDDDLDLEDVDAGESLFKATAAEYDAAIEEQRSCLAKKDQMIEDLKANIEKATVLRRQREMSVVKQKEEVEALRKKHAEDLASEEQRLNTAVQEELSWHAAVKRIRRFDAAGPPEDRAEDRKNYTRVLDTANPPFLTEVLERQADVLGRPRTGSNFDTSSPPSIETHKGVVHKMSQSKDSKWEKRFAIVTDRYLYYFKQFDGRERLLGGIYLFGASIVDMGPSGIHGKEHVVFITSTAPRRKGDANSFYFAFNSARDKELWCHWIAKESVPPMPKSMQERMDGECKAAIDSGEPVPDQWRFFFPPAAADHADPNATDAAGKTKRSNWKPDEMVLHCEGCSNPFTFFRRRHHCRGCGKIFCDSCCPKRTIMRDGVQKNKRTCTTCFELNQGMQEEKHSA